jgi:hypothetical protein
MKENQQILRRIQKAEPAYNHIEWEEEAQKNEKILANISQFKREPSGNGRKKCSLEDDSPFGHRNYHDSIHE